LLGLATCGQISDKANNHTFENISLRMQQNAENICKCKIVDVLGNFERIIYHWSVPFSDHMTEGRIYIRL
jgi:hypothetical protein